MLISVHYRSDNLSFFLSFFYSGCERITSCGISHVWPVSSMTQRQKEKHDHLNDIRSETNFCRSFWCPVRDSVCGFFQQKHYWRGPHETLPIVLFYPSGLTHISHFEDIPDQFQCSVVGNVKIEDKYTAYI